MFSGALFTSGLSILNNLKSTIIGILIIGGITYAGFYVFNLNSTITTLKLEKGELENVIADNIKTIAIKEAKLAISESLNETLTQEITKQNQEIKSRSLDNDKLNQDIVKLQQQEPSIKIIKKTKVIDCENLKQTVKKIGELKYEEL